MTTTFKTRADFADWLKKVELVEYSASSHDAEGNKLVTKIYRAGGGFQLFAVNFINDQPRTGDRIEVTMVRKVMKTVSVYEPVRL